MEKVKELQKSLETQLNQSALGQSKYFKQVEEKTKVPGIYLVAGAGAIFLIWLIFLPGGHFLTNLLTFMYPAWCSFKAIETKGKEDDTQWLTYWMMYGWFSVLEFFIETITAWIPMYFVIKLFFLIWLASEKTRGAIVVYTILRPHLITVDQKLSALLGGVPAEKESSTKTAASVGAGKDLMD